MYIGKCINTFYFYYYLVIQNNISPETYIHSYVFIDKRDTMLPFEWYACFGPLMTENFFVNRFE